MCGAPQILLSGIFFDGPAADEPVLRFSDLVDVFWGLVLLMITAMLPAAFNRTAGFLFGQPLLTLVREALGTGVCSTGPYVVMCVLVCFFVAVPEAAYHGWGRKDSVQRHDEDVGVPACAWRVAWPRHGAAVRGIGSSSNQFLVAGACACAGDCRAALIRVYLGQQYPLSAYPTLWLIGITFMVVVTGGMLQVRVLTGVAVSSLSCLIVTVCAHVAASRIAAPENTTRGNQAVRRQPQLLAHRIRGEHVAARQTLGTGLHARAHAYSRPQLSPPCTHTHTLTAVFDLDVRHDHPGDNGAGGVDTGKV